MLALCKAYQTVGISRCRGLPSGASPPPKKEKPGKINFKKFGISLNLGQRGTQFFVGCPMVLEPSKPMFEFWHNWVTSCSTSLILLYLTNENNAYSHLPGLF